MRMFHVKHPVMIWDHYWMFHKIQRNVEWLIINLNFNTIFLCTLFIMSCDLRLDNSGTNISQYLKEIVELGAS